jgi:hypothetical protein
MMKQTFRCLRLSVLVASLLALGLGACSETCKGVKEDTRKNVQGPSPGEGRREHQEGGAVGLSGGRPGQAPVIIVTRHVQPRALA